MVLSDKSFFSRLMVLLAVLLAGTFLCWLLIMVILLFQSSFDLELFSIQAANLTENTAMLRTIQLIQSVCLFILPPFVLTYLYKEHPISFLQLKRPEPMQLLVAMFSLVAAVPLINVLVIWNEGLNLPSFMSGIEEWMRTSELEAGILTERILSGVSWADMATGFVIVAVMAGFGEELFFRGLLQRLLTDSLGRKTAAETGVYPKWVMHVSIWTVAFVFSAIHLQFFGFFPRLLLGAWFGYLLWWTGSIWVPIVAHFTNNALSTAFVFAENKGALSSDPELFGTNDTWWACLFSLLLLGSCVLYFKKYFHHGLHY
jgi:hypothetical protein